LPAASVEVALNAYVVPFDSAPVVNVHAPLPFAVVVPSRVEPL